MTSLYYLERYTVLAAGFLACGALSLLLSLADDTAQFPYTSILFLGMGVAAVAYVLKNHRNRTDSSGNLVFPKLDDRELLIVMKSSWAAQEIAAIILLFAALNAGPILDILAGDVSYAVVSAVRVLLLGLFVVLMAVYLIAHAYFERKV
ncbi:hypothetical protein [Methanorbis rubei]|uniref:DUF2178 domain-containing protein n=1 Tax=Methanorbis rubei TaxID=3028300 RepID=A0AAE4SBS1_9EURY|nr:hypothetical protein [Methanocorpusculaceae archaeon Cs1]